MSIVASADMLDFLELAADDSFDNVARVQAGVEEYVKNYTGREWESADFKEEFLFNYGYSIFLKNTPITKITKIAVGTDTALTITNSNDETSAIVNVSTAGVVLTYNGSDTAGDYTFATNTTISALATAIGSAGSGWSATVTSGFSSYQSTELIPRYGAEAIKSTQVALYVPAQGLTDFTVEEETGEIFRGLSFENCPKVFANYTGGYSSVTMPADIQHAIMVMVKYVYGKLTSNRFGVDQCSVAGISAVFTKDGLPKEAEGILNMYRKGRF